MLDGWSAVGPAPVGGQFLQTQASLGEQCPTIPQPEVRGGIVKGTDDLLVGDLSLLVHDARQLLHLVLNPGRLDRQLVLRTLVHLAFAKGLEGVKGRLAIPGLELAHAVEAIVLVARLDAKVLGAETEAQFYQGIVQQRAQASLQAVSLELLAALDHLVVNVAGPPKL